MSDLDHANLRTVQSNLQPKPLTIVAAATIAPQTFLTVLSGTTEVATITPPATGCHMLAIQAGTTTAAFTTSGNIVGLTTASTTQPALFIWNPVTSKYIRTVA
jgi:hypothetical protein